MKLKKRKSLLTGILLLAVISCVLPVTVKAAGAKQPTRTGTLNLGTEADENGSEGWSWAPEADGGGTLTLTDCYIQSDVLQTLHFNNVAQKHTVTIVLKGENIIETTSQEYGSMINSNYSDGLADIVIREEGTGSLEVRTSQPINSGYSPLGFSARNFTIESGSVCSNIEICLLTDEFRMQDGSLTVCTPERIDDVFGIVSVKGPINIEGGTVDITAGHIGIITSGANGEGWSVNISGGNIKIKARQSCIQMQNPQGLQASRVINITGGTFTGESDITGLYADNINIVKEGEHAPMVTIHSPGASSNPNIMALHAIKELTVSGSIVMADTIHNPNTCSMENSIVFSGENGQVYGDVTLDGNLEIPADSTLTIPEGSTLTIPEGISLNMPKSAALNNNGMLILPEDAENISCIGSGFIKKGDALYTSGLVKLYSVTVETSDGELTNHYKAGDLVELIPETAPQGKVFKKWNITPDTVTISGNSFTMPEGAVTVCPVYEDISYEIEVIASPADGGTVSGGGTAKDGDSFTVSAQNNSGYIFSGWTENGQVVSTDAEYTFTASADRILTACFKKIIPENISYEIAVIASPADGGTVSGGGTAKDGDSFTVSAQNNSGYIFSGWTENGQVVSTDAEYTFTASADRILTACFKKIIPENISYEIAVIASPADGGTVSADGTVKEGDSFTVSAQNNSGYVFSGWTENGQVVSTDAKYTFTASADRTLTACFKKIIPENAPEKVISVENTVKAVADVKLPAGWSFDSASGTKTIPAGKSITATAVYTAEDAGNYDTIAVDIDIKRAACVETLTVLYTGTGERAPTCTTGGTGHTECRLCKDVVRTAVKMPAAGHIAGTAVVTKATIDKDGSISSHCTVCNASLEKEVIDAIGSVRLTQITGVYNARVQNPPITAKDSKGNVLKQGVDYTVIYPQDMKNVGLYSIKVTFLGNYEGTAEFDYTITPKGTSISKLKAKKKGVSLKWKSQTSQTTGYEIQYSTSKKFTKKTTKNVTVKKNKITSKSVSKQKAKKKYYVRIRTYKTVRVNGNNIKITSGWSKVKTVKTKK
ncbi:MAG: InlB B-repeat-containing protein [Clostridium sp.]|nr:InlB B-repeat-containing protein [Clostridium sp.]